MIFQSFQSGNLKQLDLEFYLRLRLPTTKRMFRFLDKRFYRRDRGSTSTCGPWPASTSA